MTNKIKGRKKIRWNEEKFKELVDLSGIGDSANNGNKLAQRKIKELKYAVLTDKTYIEIASLVNVSVDTLKKDIVWWKNVYIEVCNKSILLNSDVVDVEYTNFNGSFKCEDFSVDFQNKKFKNKDALWDYIRNEISNCYEKKFSELGTLHLSISMDLDMNIDKE